MHTESPRRWRSWRALLCWLLFGAGLGVHLLAPNLDRKDNAFVVPMALAAGPNGLQPHRIVAKERWMQVTAAVLTTAGALGLGLVFREVLSRKASPAGPSQPGRQPSDDAGNGGVP